VAAQTVVDDSHGNSIVAVWPITDFYFIVRSCAIYLHLILSYAALQTWKHRIFHCKKAANLKRSVFRNDINIDQELHSCHKSDPKGLESTFFARIRPGFD
jgi:hypothetical protein